jgi:hypothetical protein
MPLHKREEDLGLWIQEFRKSGQQTKKLRPFEIS